jgi:hypothetical protein
MRPWLLALTLAALPGAALAQMEPGDPVAGPAPGRKLVRQLPPRRPWRPRPRDRYRAKLRRHCRAAFHNFHVAAGLFADTACEYAGLPAKPGGTG